MTKSNNDDGDNNYFFYGEGGVLSGPLSKEEFEALLEAQNNKMVLKPWVSFGENAS